MTVLERLDRFPPCRCRLSARDGLGLLSTRKLAQKAGLKRSFVHDISLLTSWATVSVGVALAFSQACGVNLLKIKRRRYLLRTRKWAVLIANISPSQRGFLSKLLTKNIEAEKRAA